MREAHLQSQRFILLPSWQGAMWLEIWQHAGMVLEMYLRVLHILTNRKWSETLSDILSFSINATLTLTYFLREVIHTPTKSQLLTVTLPMRL